MTAAPRLLAGLIPVPVIGIVAKCTKNTAKPIDRGANTYIVAQEITLCMVAKGGAPARGIGGHVPERGSHGRCAWGRWQ